ncbi:MAG: aminodeoxychorismate synthase component I [Planktomarina sp.]
MQLRFDKGPGGAAQEFRAPVDVIRADTADEVSGALDALDRARANGHWVAGFISYEAGYALEPALADLMPDDRRMPLVQFGVYDAPLAADPLPAPSGAITDLTAGWDETRYSVAFDALRDLIGSGDIYQANLTMPMRAKMQGDLAGVYASLVDRQPVGHGVLMRQDEGPNFLCRSPELFFRTDARGRIETKPMKGTMPRGANGPEDAANKAFLQSDTKNRAENLMIVDLLRNDISRICEVGSVKVPDLFRVQSFATVHQMISTVVGQVVPGTGLGDMMRALFPCGSITGAPKIRSMQVIRQLEDHPRDIYCGTIGWAAPDGRCEFNVAIRTLIADGDDLRLNVGGGIVWDSTAPSEYEEALWKARYADISPMGHS